MPTRNKPFLAIDLNNLPHIEKGRMTHNDVMKFLGSTGWRIIDPVDRGELLSMEDPKLIEDVTRVMREADKLFKDIGGSTRHYVRDILLPLLEKEGLCFCKKSNTLAKTLNMNTHHVHLTQTEKELLETLAHPTAVLDRQHARDTARDILSKTQEVANSVDTGLPGETHESIPIQAIVYEQEPHENGPQSLGKNIFVDHRTVGHTGKPGAFVKFNSHNIFFHVGIGKDHTAFLVMSAAAYVALQEHPEATLTVTVEDKLSGSPSEDYSKPLPGSEGTPYLEKAEQKEDAAQG